MEITEIIEFLKLIETFKTCVRSCRTTDNSRAESDAEHSWHLAMLLLLLENEFQEVDFLKIIKLALIHDLPEIYAGDTNPYRGDSSNKEENEREAARKLFGKLSPELEESLFDLFDEYLRQESPESRIVKSADKLMPLIQNICTVKNHSSYQKLEVEYKEVLEYMEPFFKKQDVLKNLYVKLLQEAKDKDVFYKK